jgi:hypothetical protein
MDEPQDAPSANTGKWTVLSEDEHGHKVMHFSGLQGSMGFDSCHDNWRTMDEAKFMDELERLMREHYVTFLNVHWGTLPWAQSKNPWRNDKGELEPPKIKI